MSTSSSTLSPSAARATLRRRVKRDALFAEAAQQLNDRGASAIDLAALGASLGLSRNALYYYFSDRRDLLFQSYVRSCAVTALELEDASERPDAFSAITAYVSAAMAPDRGPAAILNDVDLLDEEKGAEIRALDAKNIDALRALFRQGVAEGRLREHDDELAARALTGMISWTLLSPNWVSRPSRASEPDIAASTFCSILFNGLATKNGRAGLSCPEAQAVNLGPVAAAGDDPATVKKGQIVAVASRLFNQKGVDGVSLDEIGVAMGATKGALYHHFTDKADLVSACYRRSIEVSTAIHAAGDALPPGRIVERMAISIRLGCDAQSGGLSPLMLQAGFLGLPDAVRHDVDVGMARFREQWGGLLRDGEAAGLCRSHDVAASASAIAGMVAWIPKWWTPEHRVKPAELASSLVEMVVAGLGSDDER